MFFSVTREGRPLRKRRYLFSEAFAVIALAAFGRAAGDERIDDAGARSVPSDPEVSPRARPARAEGHSGDTPDEGPGDADDPDRHGAGAAQGGRRSALRRRSSTRASTRSSATSSSRNSQCVLETVGPNGEFHDTFEGRTVCPGHAIEAGWFILEEARSPRKRSATDRARHDDHRLVAGDRMGRPVRRPAVFLRRARAAERRIPARHEAVVAAQRGDHRHAARVSADRRRPVRDVARTRARLGLRALSRSQHGEWFGYLHRDGTVSTRLKGNMWKGPFHLPRMQWYCSQRIEEMLAARRRVTGEAFQVRLQRARLRGHGGVHARAAGHGRRPAAAGGHGHGELLPRRTQDAGLAERLFLRRDLPERGRRAGLLRHDGDHRHVHLLVVSQPFRSRADDRRRAVRGVAGGGFAS